MSDEHRRYYIAAGRSLETINGVIAQRRECNVRRKAFLERVGGEDLVAVGTDIVAVTFPGGVPPKGWLKFKRHPGGFYPSRATKAGKALEREMRDLYWQELSRAGHNHIDGRYLHYCLVEKMGDEFVISQHKDAESPADATPLKHSEFWRMKEAAAPVAEPVEP